jgi:uncharacterized protein (TIGR04222 family)
MTLLQRNVLVLGPNDTLRTDLNCKLPADASMMELAVRDHFRDGATAVSLFKDGSLESTAQAHAARRLEDAGLMPGERLRDARSRRLNAALVALGVLAAAKIAVALSRGHSNVGLLVLEFMAFSFIAYHLTTQYRTPAGERALKYLMNTFGPVRDRMRSMAHPPLQDVVTVAAVFGLAPLFDVLPANVAALQPRQGGDGDGGGGCGGCGCGGCG